MTREKAKWRVRPQKEQKESSDSTHDVLTKLHNATIDEIFDDFDRRTCENCKYSTWNDGLLCAKQITEDVTFDNFRGIPIVYDNFGCNKFEEKEASNAHTS